MENSPPKKRTSNHFTVEDKERFLNIFKTLQEQPGTSKVDNVATTATAAEISERSVYKVLQEYSAEHKFQSPKKYHRKKAILDNIDDVMRNSSRGIIHSFFFKNEPPTVQKILMVINERDDLPNFKISTLRKLIRELNFRYQKRKRNSILNEKNDIITWRRQYLRKIRKYREDGTPIYYLDETWVNVGHTVKKVWADTSVLTARQAFIDGLSTGLKNPSGKRKRLIITHIRSDEGFVEDGLLLFESKKTGDYHEDMNAERCEEWLQHILPSLRENAVIVLDNAPYHSRKINKPPTINNRKPEIQQWLVNQNIPYEDDVVKAELVKENVTSLAKYAVDGIIEASNRKVLRLPPYHCELNTIELIWAQVKEYVAGHNVLFKLENVKQLFQQDVSIILCENWKNAIKHVVNVENKMWELDNLVDCQEDSLIITGDNSTTSSSSED